MQKGKLTVTPKKNKKGYQVVLHFDKKGKIKNLPVQGTGITDVSLDQAEVAFDMQKGIIMAIVHQDKEIFKRAAPSPKTSSNRRTGGKGNARRQWATAPYNFISFGEKVVPAQMIPDFDRYHEDRHTGHIELTITTQTPVYVRDTLNKNEQKQEAAAKQYKRSYQNPDFYSPGGNYAFPGSTLRGMTRALMEIVAFGRLGDFFDDKELYYRGLADKARRLRKEYRKMMTQKVTGTDVIELTPKAGYLTKGSNGYGIIPAKEDSLGCTHYRVEEKTVISNFSSVYKEPLNVPKNPPGRGNKKNTAYRQSNCTVFFKRPTVTDHPCSNGTDTIRFGLIPVRDIAPTKTPPPAGWKKGTLLWTGWMNNKHRHWVLNAPETNPPQPQLSISETVLSDYRSDDNRNKDCHLVKKVERGAKRVPCFYLTNAAGAVTAFGHTAMFRLKYETTIGDHVPDHLKTVQYLLNKERLDWIEKDPLIPGSIKKGIGEMAGIEGDKLKKGVKALLEKNIANLAERHQCKKRVYKHIRLIDLPEAIFGNTDLFAGRVFFEDADFSEDSTNKDPTMGQKTLKILGSPKETCFSHYLEQPDPAPPKQLMHYNDKHVLMRGPKLYWHQSGDKKTWGAKDGGGKRSDLHPKTTPVKSNKVFIGRVRFENLTNEELGALLFCLDLPEGCGHKLGMGKSLGLGSVRIVPALYISDRKKRYEDLFAEWVKGPDSKDKEFIDGCKKSFEAYVLGAIGETGSLWDIKRIKNLKTMLSFRAGETLETANQLNYMTPRDHGERYCLPSVDQLTSEHGF